MCTIVMMWFVAFFFATLLQELPISGNWAVSEISNLSKNVISIYGRVTTTAVLELMLDIITLLLPLFEIWKLQMRSSQKWQVSGIFLLGSL